MKLKTTLTALALGMASAGAFAQDRYDDGYGRDQYDQGRYDDGAYDYARVIDVEPLITRVRVSTPQRECWDERRVDNPGYNNALPRSGAGGAVRAGATAKPDGEPDAAQRAIALPVPGEVPGVLVRLRS